MKSGGCWSCHQLGSKGTREIPAALGSFPSSVAAWERRLQSGQAGAEMRGQLSRLGAQRALALFADWTDRIAAGEVPAPPPRPQGVERNVVITEWDSPDPKAYLHDEVSTDRRHPTLNANGSLYGSLELSADYLPVLDPARNATARVPLTVRDPTTTPAAGSQMLQPSPYWGSELIWTSKANVHNPMFDERGRVWLTATVRPSDNPAFCKAGSSHPSAKLFPLARAGRHLAVYDPRTKQLTHISTCFSTHHLMFAEDASRTLWTSGGGPVVGWLNTKLFDQTGDEEKSQGWTALILDTNGNGKRDDYVEPDQPVDPAKDKRISAGLYAVAPAPDGSIWGTSLGFPGAIVRLDPGSHPPETALAELYELPLNQSGEPVEGFSPRGGDVDRNGVYWTALASGHLASFDRRKCKGALNGPTATGQHCPEGWTFYAEPLPQLQGVSTPGSAEASYYTWVDQFGALGLGTNLPIDTGNGSEGLLVLKDGKWIVLRVPYPMGFYSKWMDGRIDENERADGFARDLAGRFMDQFRGVYGTRDEETRAVIVARQLGAPLAFGDSLWARYEIGAETHVNDPTTHAPARRNPFWSAPAESPRAHDRSTLDALLGRGVTLLLCNIAAMNWAARLAQKLERDVEETRNQVRNGLVPGAILVPSGIFALIRAQNAGCAFMRGA